MFEIDLARGFAYKGKRAWFIRSDPRGLYVEVGRKIIFLTKKNARIMEV